MEDNLGHIQNHLQKMYDFHLDPHLIEDKLTDLEDPSRRNNLKVDGIKEGPNEIWEDSLTLKMHFLMPIYTVQSRESSNWKTHRVKADKNKENNMPRTTLCRILNYKNKVKTSRNFKKKLKGKNIFINEVFCLARLDHCKGLCKEVKRLRRKVR